MIYGKSLFLRRVSDPDAFASHLYAMGFRSICPFDATPVSLLPRYAPAFKRRGFKIWPCLYNHLATWETELANLLNAARAADADGILLDPEVEWKNHAREAEAFASEARRRWPGPIGVTSYARPRFHSTFPWATFARYADFGLPQTYDRSDSWTQEDFRLAAQEYRAAGFKRVGLCGSTYHGTEAPFRTKTIAELNQHLNEIQATPATVFFTLPDFQLYPEQYPGQWKALASYDPARTPWWLKPIPGGAFTWSRIVEA